jgi:hypothetical protein
MTPSASFSAIQLMYCSPSPEHTAGAQPEGKQHPRERAAGAEHNTEAHMHDAAAD